MRRKFRGSENRVLGDAKRIRMRGTVIDRSAWRPPFSVGFNGLGDREFVNSRKKGSRKRHLCPGDSLIGSCCISTCHGRSKLLLLHLLPWSCPLYKRGSADSNI